MAGLVPFEEGPPGNFTQMSIVGNTVTNDTGEEDIYPFLLQRGHELVGVYIINMINPGLTEFAIGGSYIREIAGGLYLRVNMTNVYIGTITNAEFINKLQREQGDQPPTRWKNLKPFGFGIESSLVNCSLNNITFTDCEINRVNGCTFNNCITDDFTSVEINNSNFNHSLLTRFNVNQFNNTNFSRVSWFNNNQPMTVTGGIFEKFVFNGVDFTRMQFNNVMFKGNITFSGAIIGSNPFTACDFTGANIRILSTEPPDNNRLYNFFLELGLIDKVVYTQNPAEQSIPRPSFKFWGGSKKYKRGRNQTKKRRKPKTKKYRKLKRKQTKKAV
jgi:uncharacterized protein YjbI with pentapeptide repeats